MVMIHETIDKLLYDMRTQFDTFTATTNAFTDFSNVDVSALVSQTQAIVTELMANYFINTAGIITTQPDDSAVNAAVQGDPIYASIKNFLDSQLEMLTDSRINTLANFQNVQNFILREEFFQTMTEYFIKVARGNETLGLQNINSLSVVDGAGNISTVGNY